MTINSPSGDAVQTAVVRETGNRAIQCIGDSTQFNRRNELNAKRVFLFDLYCAVAAGLARGEGI